MADKVKVQFSHPFEKYEIGDDASLERDEARRLIRAGVAQEVTEPETSTSTSGTRKRGSKNGS